MKSFEVNINIYTTAVCEENVENWLDDFVVPDLIARWSDGTMMVETDIKEIEEGFEGGFDEDVRY